MVPKSAFLGPERTHSTARYQNKIAKNQKFLKLVEILFVWYVVYNGCRGAGFGESSSRMMPHRVSRSPRVPQNVSIASPNIINVFIKATKDDNPLRKPGMCPESRNLSKRAAFGGGSGQQLGQP